MTAALHSIALTTLFASHLMFPGEFDGVRRALQTMATMEAPMQMVETVAGADSAAA